MTGSVNPGNVYELLDLVAARKEMYLGTTRDELEELSVMLYGYHTALEVHGVVEPVPDIWLHFSDWLYDTKGWSQSQGWAKSIGMHVGAADALACFFELIGAFRTLRPVTLASKRLSVENCQTGKRLGPSRAASLVLPHEVLVVGYEGSGCHFLRYRWGDRWQNQTLLRDRSHRLVRTKNEACAWAEDEFQIDPADWSS